MPQPNPPYRRYFIALAACFALFLFRVAAQILQGLAQIPFLPPFESWQSGAIPYWLLLSFQVVIIAAFVWQLRGFAAQAATPNRNSGLRLLVFGILYIGLMLFRLIAGLTFAAGHPWLGAALPAIFHIVLASAVLIVAHYHLKYGRASGG